MNVSPLRFPESVLDPCDWQNVNPNLGILSNSVWSLKWVSIFFSFSQLRSASVHFIAATHTTPFKRYKDDLNFRLVSYNFFTCCHVSVCCFCSNKLQIIFHRERNVYRFIVVFFSKLISVLYTAQIYFLTFFSSVFH